MDITITLPDEKVDTLIKGFASYYKYKSVIDGLPNPQSKEEFFMAQIKRYVREVYKAAISEKLRLDVKKSLVNADTYTEDINVSTQ